MNGGRGPELLGLEPGMVVQELGWDEDTDQSLRDLIMDTIDSDMVEDAIEAVDAVVLWWRDDDGDLTDGLVDAMTDLAAGGWIWVLTPKVGRTGHVSPSDILEAVTTAGLALTTQANVSAQWQAHRVVRPKASVRR